MAAANISAAVVCTTFNSAKIEDALAVVVAMIFAAVFRTAINSASASSAAKIFAVVAAIPTVIVGEVSPEVLLI